MRARGTRSRGMGRTSTSWSTRAELGKPWDKADTWIRNSYPFFHADRIVTPTMFICGQLDFNVPLINSEQMYQALKSLGRETELVIYPEQYHTSTRPAIGATATSACSPGMAST